MSRKLMCLITPQGKTPEELGQAVYDAVKKYETTGEVTLDLAKPQTEWEEEIIQLVQFILLHSILKGN